jgi:hypothetical protein
MLRFIVWAGRLEAEPCPYQKEEDVDYGYPGELAQSFDCKA